MNIDLTNKELIKQYLNGSLDTATMHAIEKEALEDPFLADALDGLSTDDVHLDESIANLQYRLSQRISTKKSRFLPVFDTQRYMVAATLLITIGAAGIYFYFYRYQQTTEKTVEVALMPRPQPELKPAQPSPVKVKLQPQESLANTTQKRPLKTNISKDFNLDKEKENVAVLRNNKSIASDVQLRKLPQQAPMAEVTTTSIPANDEILIKQSSIAEAKDVSAKLSKKVAEQSKEESADNVDPSEEKTASTNNAIIANADFLISKNTASKPVDGLANYNKYLKLNTPKIDGKSAIVVLSFTINALNNLGDFKIVNSSDKSFNDAAINLVKNGPAWQIDPTKQSDTILIQIEFNAK